VRGPRRATIRRLASCGSCPAGTRCADCHADAANLLAGRFEGSAAAPDPHAQGVACADCHGRTAAANRPAALAAKCADCHTPEYGRLLSTWTAKLDALAAASSLDPGEAERLRASGVHNFTLARERLRALAKPR
jgi:hypothetical protein